MKLFSILKPLQGEKLADVVPALRPFVDDPDRLARLNFFPGRHLTDVAFTGEHQVRLRRLLLRGQAVSPGVVDGLEAGLGRAEADAFLTFGAGFGVAASGEDVVLDRTFVVRAGKLRVFDLATRKITGQLSELPLPSAKPRAGVLLWQPVSIPDDDIPRAAIPEGFEQNFSPCDREPADEAFYRRTVIDAARLVLCFWPEDWRAQPAFGGHWRNRLAWEIFLAERAGEPPPWLDAGLPVALAGFDANNRPLFVDRLAVVRQGGRPRFRTLREKAGEPRLWQAQMDQFDAHLSELASAASGLVNFRFVPPVGLLPNAFFDLSKPAGPPAHWNIQQTFFPSTYLIDVAVAPLEQLDTVFDAARDLDHYDLAKPDAVRLLLPVSQRFFDPQLLEIETVSREFLDTVATLTDARGVWRARRAELRAKDSAINVALTAQPVNFPEKDPGQLDPDETGADTIPDPAEETYGTTANDGTISVDAISELRTALHTYLKRFTNEDLKDLEDPSLAKYREKQQRIQDDEASALTNLGLRGFIAYLEDKANRADSLVDRGFLKVNADVYRLGQLLSNNALGTQFAASASLANTVGRETAPVTPGGLNLFASRLFADLATAEAQPATAVPSPAPPPAPLVTAHGAAVGDTVNIGENIAVRVAPQRFGAIAVKDIVIAGEVFSTDAGKAQLAALDHAVADNQEAKTALDNLKKASALQPEALNQVKNLAAFAEAYVPNFNSVTPKQLRAIPFERLPPPAAPKIRQDIFNTKLEVFDKLMELDISLAELTTDFVESAAAPGQVPLPALRLSFHKVITGRTVDVLDPANADEAGHFSRGVKHADMSIAALRAVETRIKLYRDLIALGREKLAVVEANLARLQSRLKVLDGELDEARHDVAVARALLDEEEARVQGINDHREQILREHVSFAVFHRPRAVEPRVETPVRAIEPALRVAPVPACLEENLSQPPDFAALAEVFRDSPARWFNYAPRWIETVDRIDHLRELMVRSVETTTTRTRAAPTASSGRFAVALTQLFTARAAVSARFVPAVKAFNPASFTTLSWLELFRRANEVLTLGHLIDAGPAKLASAAAGELNNLFKVGACLHRDFSQVTPFLRLLWAERYSQFDGPADFRNLSRLPRWNDVSFTLRREMQIHADWLYSRVDSGQPDALELIHDLIRVGLLLASHAPVDQLVTGSVAEPTTPATGGLLKLLVDPLRVRIGMEVVVHQGNQALVHGVVEDIGAGQVSARITTVPVAATLDPRMTTVRFHEPAFYSAR